MNYYCKDEELKKRRTKFFSKIRKLKEMEHVDCCSSCIFFLDQDEDEIRDSCGEIKKRISKEQSCKHISAKISNSKGEIINLPVLPHEKCKYFISIILEDEITTGYCTWGNYTPEEYYNLSKEKKEELINYNLEYNLEYKSDNEVFLGHNF